MSKFFTDRELEAELLRQEEEPLSDNESEDDEDYVEESEHDTESDLGTSLDNEEVNDASTSNNFYFSKDKNTKWNKKPIKVSGRTRKHNIITHLPGVKGVAKNAKTPHDAFKLYFDEELMNILVLKTNLYILKIRVNYKRVADAQDTDIIELTAFIGLLLMSGVYRAAHLNIEELWDEDGPSIFSLTMSYKRFLFLYRCIRFDNINSRDERKKTGKLAAVRKIIDLFEKKFELAYTPAEFTTIDEQLIPFRGRCPFRQYLPNKPKKYGIKVFALVDSRTFYLLKFEIYAGAQHDSPYKKVNTPFDIVQRLIEPLKGSGRNLTTDNWYSSVPLAKWLLENKITPTGTLRKNKREIPPEFLPDRKREVYSSIFGFTKEISMVSYVPAKSRSVVVIFTMHNDDLTDEDTGEKKNQKS